MTKTRQTKLVAILVFIVGLIFLVLGLYVSWIFSLLPGAIALSAIAILLLLLYSLYLELKIRVEIEKMLLAWGLILMLIAITICVAAAAVVQPNTTLQVVLITVILGGASIIVAKQKESYLFIIIVEIAYIMLSSSIFKNLWLYEISNILLLTVVTIILMKIAVKHCGRRINFISLLKEFVIEPLSNALSWLLFAIPFMLVLTSIFVTWNLIPLPSFGGWIKLELVFVGAICGALAIIKKLYRECYMDELMVIIIAIIVFISLVYSLGIYRGWIELSLKSLHDLEPILMTSFMIIAFFIHTPMICLITNKDKCKELNKF